MLDCHQYLTQHIRVGGSRPYYYYDNVGGSVASVAVVVGVDFLVPTEWL